MTLPVLNFSGSEDLGRVATIDEARTLARLNAHQFARVVITMVVETHIETIERGSLTCRETGREDQ